MREYRYLPGSTVAKEIHEMLLEQFTPRITAADTDNDSDTSGGSFTIVDSEDEKCNPRTTPRIGPRVERPHNDMTLVHAANHQHRLAQPVRQPHGPVCLEDPGFLQQEHVLSNVPHRPNTCTAPSTGHKVQNTPFPGYPPTIRHQAQPMPGNRTSLGPPRLQIPPALTNPRFLHRYGNHSSGPMSLGGNIQTQGLYGNVAELQVQPMPSQPRPYIPSTMVLGHQGVKRDPARMPAGSNYCGDAFGGSYLDQVLNLPDYQNCALWLTGLPANTKHAEILDIIHCGAVWSLHLNEPTPQFPTMAAKLVFITAHAAAKFIQLCRQGGFCTRGHWVTVKYNKYGMKTRCTRETRVLQIQCLEAMTPQFWIEQFQRACVFQMVHFRLLPCPVKGMVAMEFHFARVDGQAQSCRQMIEREFAVHGVSIQYGADPCGV